MNRPSPTPTLERGKHSPDVILISTNKQTQRVKKLATALGIEGLPDRPLTAELRALQFESERLSAQLGGKPPRITLNVETGQFFLNYYSPHEVPPDNNVPPTTVQQAFGLYFSHLLTQSRKRPNPQISQKSGGRGWETAAYYLGYLIAEFVQANTDSASFDIQSLAAYMAKKYLTADGPNPLSEFTRLLLILGTASLGETERTPDTNQEPPTLLINGMHTLIRLITDQMALEDIWKKLTPEQRNSFYGLLQKFGKTLPRIKIKDTGIRWNGLQYAKIAEIKQPHLPPKISRKLEALKVDIHNGSPQESPTIHKTEPPLQDDINQLLALIRNSAPKEIREELARVVEQLKEATDPNIGHSIQHLIPEERHRQLLTKISTGFWKRLLAQAESGNWDIVMRMLEEYTKDLSSIAKQELPKPTPSDTNPSMISY